MRTSCCLEAKTTQCIQYAQAVSCRYITVAIWYRVWCAFHALLGISHGVQIAPVDFPVRSIFLHEPVVRSFKVTVAKKAPVSAEGRRVLL